MRRLLWAGMSAVVVGGSFAGCATEGLSFRADERVEITAPADRATVELPQTFEWTVRDFEVTGRSGEAGDGAGLFALFLDRTPVGPGDDVDEALSADEEARCGDDRACRDAALAQRGVWVTEDTRLTVDQVGTTGRASDDLHRLTLVLVDGRGRRVGESAFSVEFRVDEG